MFYSCPHCRELVATDPLTREPPELCPRCGGSLRLEPAADAPPAPAASVTPVAASAAAPSLATFLQVRAGPSDAAMPPVESPAGPAAPLTMEPDGAAERATVETSTDEDVHSPPGDAATGAPAVAEDRVDAFDETTAAPAPDAAAAVQVHANSTDPQRSTRADTGTDTGTGTGTGGDPAETEADVHATSAAADAAPEPAPPAAAAAPAFTRAPRTHPVSRRAAAWQWIAVAVLALGLLLQVLVADRARLAAEADWRPLMTGLCGALGCTLPPWRQPEAFTMLSRDVRPIPGTPSALRVQATFRNDARWTQPWPALLLSLSDADGRVVGARAFSAGEYLDASTTANGLAPGQSAQVVLQLREPGTTVVAFSFDFR